MRDGRTICLRPSDVQFADFVAIVIEKEIDPYDEDFQAYRKDLWLPTDDACNYIFILELIVNLFQLDGGLAISIRG